MSLQNLVPQFKKKYFIGFFGLFEFLRKKILHKRWKISNIFASKKDFL
jgi:hypothetical protein